MTEQARLQAERRRVNFFAGTHRSADELDLAFSPQLNDPQRTSDQSLEHAALSQIRKAIESRADALKFKLPEAALADMLSKAQSALRTMTRTQLQSLSMAGGSVELIANTSFNSVVTADPKLAAALQAARSETMSADLQAQQLARLAQSRLVSSATRDREIGGSEAARERQAMDGARAEATKLGMPWAMNNPDLLRLGPSAIRTLHDAGVRRETFERLTSERVGFRAATTVAMAAWAKRRDMNPEQTNQMMHRFGDLNEGLVAGLEADERRRVQRELDRAAIRYFDGQDTPQARNELRSEYMRHAQTPQQREHVERTFAQLEQDRKVHASSAQRDAVATVSRNSDVEQRNRTATNVSDAFDAPVPSSPPQRTETHPPAEKPKQDSTAPQSRQSQAAPKGP